MDEITSVVDLLSNEVWIDEDIVRRTESMISSKVPPDRFAILSRLLLQQMMGGDPMSHEDAVMMGVYQAACKNAGEIAKQSRIDNALLVGTIRYETALQRLSLEPVVGDTNDYLERSSASMIVSAATQDIKDLAQRRKPEPLVDPTPIMLQEEQSPVTEVVPEVSKDELADGSVIVDTVVTPVDLTPVPQQIPETEIPVEEILTPIEIIAEETPTDPQLVEEKPADVISAEQEPKVEIVADSETPIVEIPVEVPVAEETVISKEEIIVPEAPVEDVVAVVDTPVETPTPVEDIPVVEVTEINPVVPVVEDAPVVSVEEVPADPVIPTEPNVIE